MHSSRGDTRLDRQAGVGAGCRYLQNITVPAAFVTKSVGDTLKGLIKPTRSDKDPHAMVSLDWTDILPRSEVVGAGGFRV